MTSAPVAVATAAEPKPGRHLVFGVVAIGLFMMAVDQTIVATALEAIQRDLHTRVNWSSWTITVYALGQILAMPLSGRLSDQYGRKRVFLSCAGLFVAASLACGLATNIQTLLVLRAVQALGGGGLMPSATGIVADQYGRDRDRAIGFFSSIFPIGGITGPILGGVFVTYWSWRGIFLINVPLGLLMILGATVIVPPDKGHRPGRFDLAGLALLGGGLLTAMLAISYLGVPTTSPTDGWVVGAAVAAAGLFVAFLRHSSRAPAPFVPIGLLAGHGFGVVNLLNFMFGAAMLGFAALVPLYAQQRFGLSALSSGTLLTARAVGMVIVAGAATIALRRTGPRAPMLIGFLFVATGMALLAGAPHGLTPYAWLATAAAVTGIGSGFSTPATNNAGLQLTPDSLASAAGLRGMFRQAGGITAVSLVTAVVARTAHPAATEAHAFLTFAVLIVLLVPLVRLIPDHRGTW